MKYLLEIRLPEYLAVEDELEQQLKIRVARRDFEIGIREWLLDFLTTDVPYTAVRVRVDDG